MIQKLIQTHFLGKYENADYFTQQKARVFTELMFAGALILSLLFSVHLFMDRPPLIIVMRTAALFTCLAVLFIIRAGHLLMAGIIALTAVLGVVWIVMFIDEGPLILKTDTIVLAIAAYTSGPLVLESKKHLVFVFWAINIVLLIFFAHHLYSSFGLQFKYTIEYFIDNSVAMLFVALISYMVIAANSRALKQANKATIKAEKESAKNKALSESLELKVDQRTAELSKNNAELQKEITERINAEKQLRIAQQKLVEDAHKAGMAEIASDTLHNVGNILNSVKTSTQMIDDIVTNKPQANYRNACDMIRENRENMVQYLTEDPKGRLVIDYFLKLDENFDIVFSNIAENTKRLENKINTISEVILAQQSYTGTFRVEENVLLSDVVEDSLALIPDLVSENQVKITKEYQTHSRIRVQKTKLLHTLVNILKNSIQAMKHLDKKVGQIDIKVYESDSHVIAMISDNGEGITKENLNKIFNHGFTTKNEGRGFGLHSCANYLQEMGASIEATSEGPSLGATFIIKFPL